MIRLQKWFSSKWMVLPPIVLGLLILVLMVKTRNAPVIIDSGEPAKPVRVVPALQVDMVPRVQGYGTVQPEQTWRGVAEVSGKVVIIRPELQVGALLHEGITLLRIDPLEYEIAVTRAEAQVLAVSAQLKELELELENAKLSLDLEQQNLRLLERDYRRNLSLATNASISETVTEQTEREVLRQRLQVQNRENQLAVLPAKMEQLRAQRTQTEAILKDARRRLAKTEIRMPFTGRIALKNVELGQAVNAGAVLIEADGIEKAEIEVGLALDKMNALVKDIPIDFDQEPVFPESFEGFNLEAMVRLRTIGPDAVWHGKLSRVSASLDHNTRTVGAIVTVLDPYRKRIPGKRPPLVKGMLCEVEIIGPARNALIIPRAALHEKRVYVSNAENRLETREVSVGTIQAGFVEIIDGLSAGERVVISDLEPAVAGMLLEPTNDDAAQRHLEQQAAGEGGVR